MQCLDEDWAVRSSRLVAAGTVLDMITDFLSTSILFSCSTGVAW